MLACLLAAEYPPLPSDERVRALEKMEASDWPWHWKTGADFCNLFLFLNFGYGFQVLSTAD